MSAANNFSRRQTLPLLLLGAAATVAGAGAAAPRAPARGIEGQRKPDPGNGTYLSCAFPGKSCIPLYK
jgi:hypothetical protein